MKRELPVASSATQTFIKNRVVANWDDAIDCFLIASLYFDTWLFVLTEWAIKMPVSNRLLDFSLAKPKGQLEFHHGSPETANARAQRPE